MKNIPLSTTSTRYRSLVQIQHRAPLLILLIVALAAGRSNAVEPVQRLHQKAYLPLHTQRSNHESKAARVQRVKSAPQAHFERIAYAIRRAEGVWTYGVKTVSVKTEAEARQVCLNTIRHAWKDWNGKGSFINFFADRYCPPSDDPQGNINWKRNVKFFLKQKP